MTTPSGRPLVVLCVGTGRGDRHEEHEGAGLRGLRDAVRRTPGAVLVTTGCLRGCAATVDDRCAADHAVGMVAWRVGAWVTDRPVMTSPSPAARPVARRAPS